MKQCGPYLIIAIALLLAAWGGESASAARLRQTVTPAPIHLPAISGGGAPTSTPTPTSTATPAPTPTATLAWIAILEERFEGGFPAGWEVFDNGAGNGEYFWARRDCRAQEGNYGAWAIGGGADGAALTCLSQYPNLVESWMVYGPFSLTQARAAELSVMLWLNTQRDQDTVSLCASKDGGRFGCAAYGEPLSDWRRRTLDLGSVPALGSLLGEPQVWVALIFSSDGDIALFEGVYADDVIVRQVAQ